MTRAWLLVAVSLLGAVPAAAQGPEQLDQLEPGAGEWQAEYFATIGPQGKGEHAIEAMWGISDRLAVGFEVEAEYEEGELAFETVGPKVLYRFTGDGAPVAMGVQLQLGFDASARLAEAEARLIVEARSGSWWAQGNFMLRRSRGDIGDATRLAYALSLQRNVFDFAWIGVEASGQSAPLWANTGSAGERGDFVGPSLTFEWEPSPGQEVELGIAYLQRLGGDGVGSTGRIFAQLSF